MWNPIAFGDEVYDNSKVFRLIPSPANTSSQSTCSDSPVGATGHVCASNRTASRSVKCCQCRDTVSMVIYHSTCLSVRGLNKGYLNLAFCVRAVNSDI